MAAIEESSGLEARAVDIIETARVDCDSVRLGTRHVECVHSAMRAECVLGHAGTKRITRQRILAAQQFEILWRNRQVEDALLGTGTGASSVNLRPQGGRQTCLQFTRVFQTCRRIGYVRALFSNLINNQSGVTAIEYALIAALIAVAAIAAFTLVGTNLSATFSTIAGKL